MRAIPWSVRSVLQNLRNKGGRMNRSESIKELAAALSKAQGDMKHAIKELKKGLT